MNFGRYVPVVFMPTLILGSWAALAHPKLSSTSTQPLILKFAAKVGSQPFACGTTYSLGKPATQVTPNDFRFYVSEVALLDAKGKATPVTLEQDGKWQYQSVALLDFENKTGACANGTTEMRDRIIGTVPKGSYTGLKFTLGVPFELNHGDATLAPSPLNLTGLWWNWQLGYKFVRLDLQKPATHSSRHSSQGHSPQGHSPKSHQPTGAHGQSGGFLIHLGSTGCAAQPPAQTPTVCKNPNKAVVTLPRFNAAQNIIVADLAQLVSKADLSQNQPKTAPGCMSDPEDRDCQSIFAHLGLPFKSQPAIPQTFFSIK
ncbi:MAG: metallo-mystery pair system four-Cys motif protein [Thermosynechococcaceae cyanobacterium MS004]|nr:metallo-mystery pair system four-Cys motif protein [Thermosynechococcaceae cyanobacterium MS004]